MKLEHSFTVPTGIDEAWKILLDIERIGPCMPGAAIDSVDGDAFTGTVKVKLGPIGLTYKGKASFIEKDEPAHRAVIDARGKDSRGNGTASAKVTATLSEAGGSTRVQVNTDLDITGKPAQFGRGVMVDVGNKLIGQFADNLAETIGADNTAAAPAAAEKPVSAEAQAGEPVSAEAQAGGLSADEAARSVGPDPIVDEAALQAVARAPAAYSAPGAGAAAVNGGAGVNGARAKSARPQREVEPINLIESVGPAVAKRLAPVAVALLVVLIAVRRRRSNH